MLATLMCQRYGLYVRFSDGSDASVAEAPAAETFLMTPTETQVVKCSGSRTAADAITE